MKRLKTLLNIASLWLLLVGLAHAGTVHYYYTDPQGTPLVKTDASGNVIARYDYAPYGAAVASLGSAPNGPGYTGHVNDPETGLVYMQARYYDPALGRFLSIDPVAPSAGNGFSFNRYAYADNNPVVRTDPDGRESPCATMGNCLNNPGSEWASKVATQYAIGVAKPMYNDFQKLDNLKQGHSDLTPATASNETQASGMVLGAMIVSVVESVAFRGDSAEPAESTKPDITAPYKRPPGATTRAQRASVQGKPCVTCGEVAPRQVADHIVPLVQEYYQTGTIDLQNMRSTDAVQPQCPACSARQGAEMSRYSQEQRNDILGY